MIFKDKLNPEYVCETVKIIKDVTKYQLLESQNLEAIIVALRKGPKTVNELEIDYNAFVKEKIQKMNLTRKEEEVLEKKMFRQAKTLYKYIKVLKENGFVVDAGKRYTENQRAAETLYGRTAKLFFYIRGEHSWLDSENIKPSLDFMSKLLGIMNQSKQPSVKKLREILISMETKVNQDLENLFTTFSKEIADISEDISYEDLTFLIFGLNLILLMKNYPVFEDDLKRSNII
ncbi:MAG: hypothetical protein H7644_09950 [Candidatus Heimdallarchaeota archaeon]|nr:hypothetical protein [Candidatus Heimdallarchaeota archaeon]MCK5144078.1 hypothetical protein [Candidatus Heimdallarchaeota archaeon]